MDHPRIVDAATALNVQRLNTGLAQPVKAQHLVGAVLNDHRLACRGNVQHAQPPLLANRLT